MQDNCFLDFIDPELYSHSTKMSQGINDDKKSLQNFTKAIEGKIEEGSKKTQSLFSSACIYKVPEGLRKLNKSAYTPRVIAIGPLHRKDKHLQESMQRVKWYYTHHLLNRLTEGIEDENQKGRKLSEVLQQCAEKMKDKECVDKAKTYYAAEVTVDDEKMSEMMLVDGCFVLELLYASHSDKKSKEAGKMTTNGVDSGINLKVRN
ncbi:hypothetical protein RHGRI_038960 [Rhododendron griersonianum]|uniref:Uncharacterized protein n=1 Tax=Rhododendron griersonianum TaxID=479676 RepID=A0AAV6HN62_9ERIC|nr:hypothetical protein RHGRI_038960 [Rhododendron griersonianum]